MLLFQFSKWKRNYEGMETLSFFLFAKDFMSDKCLIDMDYSSTACLPDYCEDHVYKLVL